MKRKWDKNMIKANSFWKYYTTGVTKTAPTDSLDAIQ